MKLETLAEDLQLEYEAEFVPWSASRNAKSNPSKASDLSLNWKVHIKRLNQRVSTDYSQGIGHIPGYRTARVTTLYEWDKLKRTVETGDTHTYKGETLASLTRGKKIPPPELQDVLYCLLQDGRAIDYSCFEDWAQEYGYDLDSRKAERTYRDCVAIGLRLRAMIGPANLEKLQVLYQDY